MNAWTLANKQRACPICQHTNRCLIAPDGTAAKCWRNDGKVHQLARHEKSTGTGYLGKTHRKPANGETYATDVAAIEDAGRSIDGGKLMNVWQYTDAAGAPLMAVARFDLEDGSKQFRPVHLNCTGWKLGDPAGKLPLYKLATLPAAGMVWIVEGEKCADAAETIHLPAVTSSHGAMSADKSDCQPLAGREVAILPDADKAGEGYARTGAANLAKLDPPARVKIVHLPGLGDGEDIADYIDARDSMGSEDISQSVLTLANAVPWIDPSENVGGPVLVCMADVEARETSWLWPGRIALGRITLLVGKPGEGKSFLAIDAAARVTLSKTPRKNKLISLPGRVTSYLI